MVLTIPEAREEAAVDEVLLGWSSGLSMDICANGETGPSPETSWTDEVGEGERLTEELIFLASAVHTACVYRRYKIVCMQL